MRFTTIAGALFSATFGITTHAHLIGDPAHDGLPVQYAQNVTPPTNIIRLRPQALNSTATNRAAQIAAVFAPFAPKVTTRANEKFFFVESDGMPAHRMMVGITAWQQQVPLPQSYFGDNAWQFPLWPTVAANPLSARTHFFRGAIAIAANGVPIFNPIKNDGRTDTFLAGELDEFGGHAGRADDYHYHIAPLHLQKLVGTNQPVAFALDGYAIYGLTEPDRSASADLDVFNGHSTASLGYHYHASPKYPYVNGGFHGEVIERDGQVDPQPRAESVRPATTPLRGAKIVGFNQPNPNTYSLAYQIDGATNHVNYAIQADGAVKFDFADASGKVESKTYQALPQRNVSPNERQSESTPRGPNPSNPNRQPWLKVHAPEMDADHNGTLTRDEFVVEVEKTFAGYDKDGDGKISLTEREGPGVRSAMGGFVKQHAAELDTNGDGDVTKAEMLAVTMRMFDHDDPNHDGKITPEEFANMKPGGKPRREAQP